MVYLLWLPLAEPMLTLVARAAEVLLSWVWMPPLVTDLEVSGDTVEIRGLLYQPGQWMGRWAAGNLPIFIIAALGLAIAVPVRDAPDRVSLVGGTILACFVAMVALAAVEVTTVAASWAAGREKLTLLTGSELAFIETAHGSVDVVQMLLPAALALVAYGLLWADDGAAGVAKNRWRAPVWIWISLVFVLGLAALPVRTPDAAARLERLSRTAELNPGSAKPWLAYAEAARVAGSPNAVSAFERARANGANAHAVRIGLAQTFLSEKRFEDALETAEQALREGPASPILLSVEARSLLGLGRACEAAERLGRALAARRSTRPLPGLQQTRAGAARACLRERGPAS